MLSQNTDSQNRAELAEKPELYLAERLYLKLIEAAKIDFDALKLRSDAVMTHFHHIAEAHGMPDMFEGITLDERLAKLQNESRESLETLGESRLAYLHFIRTIPAMSLEILAPVESQAAQDVLLAVNNYEQVCSNATALNKEISNREANIVQKMQKIQKIQTALDSKLSEENEQAEKLPHEIQVSAKEEKRQKQISDLRSSIDSGTKSLEKLRAELSELESALLAHAEKRMQSRATLGNSLQKAQADLRDAYTTSLGKSFAQPEDVAKIHKEIIDAVFALSGKTDPLIQESIELSIKNDLKRSVSNSFSKDAPLLFRTFKRVSNFDVQGDVFRNLAIRVLKDEDSKEIANFKNLMVKALVKIMPQFVRVEDSEDVMRKNFPHLTPHEVCEYAKAFKSQRAEAYLKVLETRRYEGVKIDNKKVFVLALSALFHHLSDNRDRTQTY